VPVPVPVSPGLVTLLVRVLQECQTHAMTHLHGCLHGPGMGLCVVPIWIVAIIKGWWWHHKFTGLQLM